MTCIVGLLYKKCVYLGGDSAGVSGLDLTVRADQKVFKNKGFIFGFTSSFRMGQLLRYKLEIPPPPVSQTSEAVYRYMVTEFIDSVRTCLKDGGCAKNDKSGGEIGGVFLVGYQNRLFSIDSDYQVGIPSAGYDAVGCGDAYALGSLFSSQKEKNAQKRIKLALEAAAHLSGGVCPPFNIIHT